MVLHLSAFRSWISDPLALRYLQALSLQSLDSVTDGVFPDYFPQKIVSPSVVCSTLPSIDDLLQTSIAYLSEFQFSFCLGFLP